jgi:hypothetical protein
MLAEGVRNEVAPRSAADSSEVETIPLPVPARVGVTAGA